MEEILPLPTTSESVMKETTATSTGIPTLPVKFLFKILKFFKSLFLNEAPTSSSSHSLIEETITLGDPLPLDLVAEIIYRLPVKQLLQMCCVSKSWNSLISNDHGFAKKHLCSSTIKLKHLFIKIKEFTVMSYPLDSLQLHSIFTTNPTQLDYSLINPKYPDRLIASCDGLLCFAINKSLALLWNPTIRKFKELPSLRIPFYGRNIYSFGYDPLIDNYKVVSVFYNDFNKNYKTHVKIHTLGEDSWRRIQVFPSMVPSGEPGIFVGGTVNWLAYSNSGSPAIISLHSGKESYREISQPDYGMSVKLTMCMLRDCLCIVSHSDSFNDVWLLKEYTNQESWVKLIHLPYFGGDHGNYAHGPKIVYISEDNDHVLLMFKEFAKLKWVVYDSKNDTTKTIKIQDFSLVDAKVYIESLVSP